MQKVKKTYSKNKKLLAKRRANPRYEEARIQKWVIENDGVLERKDGIYVIDCEVTLPKALETLKIETHYVIYGEEGSLPKPKVFGRIDYLFRYKGANYAAELKCQPFANTDFWEALKIIGYTAYYNWWRNTNYKPAIIIPIKDYCLEHFIVASKLHLKLFGFQKTSYGYSIKEVRSPRW